MLALNNHIFPALEYVCFLLAFSVSLVAVNGGYSLCCAGASCCGGLSCCGAGALGASASVVAACGSWSMLAAVLWLTDLVALQCVGSSQTRDGTRVFCITRQIFFFLTTEPPWKPPYLHFYQLQTISVMRNFLIFLKHQDTSPS